MKKTSILLLAICLSFSGFSQVNTRDNSRNETKKYMEENIFPEIKKQQEIYMDKLTNDEKNQLDEIRAQMVPGKQSPNQRPQRNGKGEMRNSKSNNNFPNRTKAYEDVKKITDNYPKLNSSYLEFVDSNKEKWMTDIAKIHDGNYGQSQKNKNGNSRFNMFFDRIDNPEWLLLWDPANQRNMNQRQNKSGQGNNGNRIGKQSSSRLSMEQKSYISENIIPVIAEERKSFDANLSFDEKEIIQTAREKRQVRDIMFKNWYESEDFVPGQRANDPNFDNMREDMQKSMQQVREIASAHSDEISESLSNIRTHSDIWKNDMKDFGGKRGNRNGNKQMKHSQKGGQNIFRVPDPIRFLLFDPATAKNSDIFNTQNDVRVTVFPNPVTQNATIAVMGAIDANVTISLYSKSGEKIKDIYNALNMDERLEVSISAQELKSDVYIVKIITDNSEITRKIVVEK